MASPLAGQNVPPQLLENIPNLISRYYTRTPDMANPAQRVSFGTSGHRGSSLKDSFTEAHILAIVQAIVDVRKELGVTGPLFLGMDTHALSIPAHETAVCVLAANGIQTRIAPEADFTPTPVISRSVLQYNDGRNTGLADGIVITPSHNPPSDGGIKYNGTHGGPSGTDVTGKIAAIANQYLENGNREVRRLPVAQARTAACIQEFDYISAYVEDLKNIIDFDVIRNAKLRLCADALGGSGLAYWPAIAKRYGLDITVRHGHYDPTFRFMCVDHDGKIRMDCSSPYAMAGLVSMKDDYDLGFANDPDFDRHGIVCPRYGLMSPNHYLAVAIRYLFRNRPNWPADAGIGKTLVSSMMIDRVADSLHRPLGEVPVGFKWFVDGLTSGMIAFGGEESAGASFLQKNGRVWTTDKDGMILALLAAEITAATGKSPAEHYAELEEEFGKSYYTRKDTPATPESKKKISSLQPENVVMKDLAGDPLECILTRAPGNQAAIGGLKLQGRNSWAAVRPSGTEDICKVYAESFLGQEHLEAIIRQASSLL